MFFFFLLLISSSADAPRAGSLPSAPGLSSLRVRARLSRASCLDDYYTNNIMFDYSIVFYIILQVYILYDVICRSKDIA